MLKKILNSRQFFYSLIIALAGIFVIGLISYVEAATAPQPTIQAAQMHPAFSLLDANEQNVLTSRKPISTAKTCGACHDTAFITTHSFHADLGYSESKPAGQITNGHAWDTSTGLYGKWNPLTYRYLSPTGDAKIDLTPAEWLKVNAARIVGGGPAEKAAGLEMDCFLCHFTNPNNAERVTAIQSNNVAWANTASLVGTGIVEKNKDQYTYNANAFNSKGELQRAFITIQDPNNNNCAQCHGLVHNTPNPLTNTGRDLSQWQTATTGQIVSAQKISQSGMNIKDKAQLTRAWDIHAERGLECVDCHYSLNNPILAQTNAKAQPEHVLFDPRRLDISEYLQKPSHQFARGQSAQFTVAADLKGTMRRCESCHETSQTHTWLPYTTQHMNVVACETCHIPQVYAPAVQSINWTVLKANAEPVIEWRGVQGTTNSLSDLITGYTPVLLKRNNIDGTSKLAPYNLITAWYWVYESNNGQRPVRLEDLKAAYFEKDAYQPEVLKALDTNGDKTLSDTELILDTAAKQGVIANRLQALGLNRPQLASEVQPYSVNHNVTRGDYAISDCAVCHNDNSRIGQGLTLTTANISNVTPSLVKDANIQNQGNINGDGNTLSYAPIFNDTYVFGHNRVSWIDWLGVAMLFGVLIGVSVHGGLRLVASLKLKGHGAPAIKRVYMYAVYERFWHWLQTFAILLLIFTGLVIHRPDMFGIFSFPYIVVMHNVLAAILVINAALSLFYHLVSGEIQQFIPRPYGFFDQAIVQAKFYMQGIFKNDPHPFEKTPEKKLNPLQQITYFGILNVLLPLQVITGAMMWGVQSFPQISAWFGGLPFLAPFHSLVAWSFASFIIAHVYLTTTGHEPLANMKAMMMGWDEVEAGQPAPQTGD